MKSKIKKTSQSIRTSSQIKVGRSITTEFKSNLARRADPIISGFYLMLKLQWDLMQNQNKDKIRGNHSKIRVLIKITPSLQHTYKKKEIQNGLLSTLWLELQTKPKQLLRHSSMIMNLRKKKEKGVEFQKQDTTALSSHLLKKRFNNLFITSLRESV